VGRDGTGRADSPFDLDRRFYGLFRRVCRFCTVRSNSGRKSGQYWRPVPKVAHTSQQVMILLGPLARARASARCTQGREGRVRIGEPLTRTDAHTGAGRRQTQCTGA
jgi:hypothetical protein